MYMAVASINVKTFITLKIHVELNIEWASDSYLPQRDSLELPYLTRP